MTDIVTITVNPALDLSTEAAAVIPDQKLRCSAPLTHPGGGGVNVSRAIAKLGGSSRSLLAYGGGTGQTLVSMLRAEGLEPQSLGVSHATRQSLSVRDGQTGLQYRFMLPGPDWSDAECTTARDTILNAIGKDTLVVPSGSLPPGMDAGFFPDLQGDIAAKGGRMILDTSGKALALAASRPLGLYVLRMDRDEARGLSGAPLETVQQIAVFAAALRDRGVARIVMIAAGAEGTVIASEDWRGLTRPPAVKPLSKIGAGDSFVAGFALAIIRGADPVAACCAGTAAATSAVTTDGTELCKRDDTERFRPLVRREAL